MENQPRTNGRGADYIPVSGLICMAGCAFLGVAVGILLIEKHYTPTWGTVAAAASISLAIGIIVAVTDIISQVSLRRQLNDVLRGYPITPLSKPETRAPVPLTDAQKINALYQLSIRQGRSQFMSNLLWSVFGIIGGYLAGQLLPH